MSTKDISTEQILIRMGPLFSGLTKSDSTPGGGSRAGRLLRSEGGISPEVNCGGAAITGQMTFQAPWAGLRFFGGVQV